MSQKMTDEETLCLLKVGKISFESKGQGRPEDSSKLS